MSTPLPQDRYVKVGNINTRYWQIGDKGSTVILIHGFPSSLDIWNKNIIPLAQNHRVFTMDWLGSGRTDKLPLVKDLNVLTEFIIDFLNVLRIDKASLIGNSMGAGLALQLTMAYPQKVDKLVLVDSAGLGPEVNTFYRIISNPFLGRLILKNSTPENTRKVWEAVVYDHTLITQELINLYYELNQLPGSLDATISIAQAGASILGQRAKYWKPVRNALEKIKKPTLIIWGQQDKIIPVKHAKIAAKIPGSRLHVFNKCGHIPMFECPDEFNNKVLDFLAE
jgi:pimeloyl-ACP methyl ester carboxylesterase